jgi:HK97 family phage prohead protease
MPVPNAAMRDEAQRGLDWRREFGRGGTGVGVARARDIVNGRDLSLDTVARMASYFARHEVDKQGEGWSPGEDGYPSAGRIAWALWGGDPGRSWADEVLESDDDDNGRSKVPDRMHDRLASAGQFEVRESSDGDGLTIAGYIAKFNEPTQISDFLGDYTEKIKPGAFRQTLRERGTGGVKMQFNHGADPTFGPLPIGVWTSLREDRHGLWGEGRLHDNWHTIPIRAAIESGALDGMSFRFKVKAEEWVQAKRDGEQDHRTLTEVALFEAGPVVHPAYEGTTVGVRARALDLLRGVQSVHDVDGETSCATIDDEPVVRDAGETQAEHDPPVGITRREMRLAALSRIGVIDNDEDRGAA